MKKKTNASPLLAKMLATAEKPTTLATAPSHTTSIVSASSQLNEAIKLHQSGQLNEAAAIYQRLLQQSNLDSIQQARVHSLLGTTYLQQNNFQDAEKHLQAALVLNAKDASTHNNLGVTYKQLGNKEAALVHFKQAITLDPNYADVLNNYGAALIDQRKQQEAITYLDRAIAIKPDYADSHYNRGTALQSLKRFDEAEASFQQALAINPHFTSALFNSGLLRLLRGEFEQGWRLYEYRWNDVQARQYVRNFSQPLWLGNANLSGKTIYLYAEQGLGDFIQFCRYTLLVEKLGAKIILLVPQELMALARSLSQHFTFIARKGTETAINLPFDYHCPILSLPLAFKTTVQTIPAQVPYLASPQDRILSWQKKLGPKSLPRIGLVWSGAAGHLNDANRSIPLAAIAPLLAEEAEYHVLQKDIRPSDTGTLEALTQTHSIKIHGDDLGDFSDTAALINEMDLVISVDTSVAHLAGALAKPVWILIAFFPDFRWLLDREDTPWYPTARLFRQVAMNDWSSTLQQLQIALKAFISHQDQEIITQETLRAHIDHGLSLHQAGKFIEAFAIYQQILDHFPENTEVLTLVASLHLQQKHFEQSRLIFEKSLGIDDRNALTLHNYALLLEKLNRNLEAIQYLDKALAINPLYEDAYKHKANLLKKTKQIEEGLNFYQLAIEKLPQSADLHFRFANELKDAGRGQEALAVIDQAIKLNNKSAQAYNNRGNILLDLKQPYEAIKSYQLALAINPRYANAYNNCANAFLALNQFEEAIAACDAALAIDPNLLTTLNNRANALQKLKRFDEAMQAYDRVIREYKDYSFAPLNKGLLCLLQGNFSEGWPLYEARWNAAPQPRLMEVFKQPLWLGKTSIVDKIVLLHAEQGYGDSIQFCRYVALVLAAGAKKVYLNVPKVLFNLVRESISQLPKAHDIKVLTDGDKVPQFDYQTPLMSLPLAFNTELHNIPANVPYLFANESLIKKWQQRLGVKTKLRVGVVWCGSSAYSNDSNRSIPLNLLTSLLTSNMEFHSLQKEIKPEDGPAFKDLRIYSHQEYLTDFSETAALIHLMDLVISVDTSVAHLAGAMGKPVWILLPFVPDFRWLLDRDDSPWYPTVVLYRQPDSGNWTNVIGRLQKDLHQFLLNQTR